MYHVRMQTYYVSAFFFFSPKNAISLVIQYRQVPWNSADKVSINEWFDLEFVISVYLQNLIGIDVEM